MVKPTDKCDAMRVLFSNQQTVELSGQWFSFERHQNYFALWYTLKHFRQTDGTLKRMAEYKEGVKQGKAYSTSTRAPL